MKRKHKHKLLLFSILVTIGLLLHSFLHVDTISYASKQSKDLHHSVRQIELEHIVEKGQTAYRISKTYYTNDDALTNLLTYNQIDDPKTDMKIGMKIKVPNPDIVGTHIVQKGDTLYSITSTFFNKFAFLKMVMDYNRIANPEIDVKVGMEIYVPVNNQMIRHTVKSKETLYSIVNTYYHLPSLVKKVKEFNNIQDVSTDVKMNDSLKIPNVFKALFLTPKKTVQKPLETNGMYIEIDRSTNTLKVIKSNQVIFTRTVATGKNDTTPVGTFEIVTKIKLPGYTPKQIPGGDPTNPLGSRWLGLNSNGTSGRTYGIHGTNNPSSIGEYASKGCVRMLNKDIEWLYDNIPVGTKVVVK